jgi:hypothetical protein
MALTGNFTIQGVAGGRLAFGSWSATGNSTAVPPILAKGEQLTVTIQDGTGSNPTLNVYLVFTRSALARNDSNVASPFKQSGRDLCLLTASNLASNGGAYQVSNSNLTYSQAGGSGGQWELTVVAVNANDQTVQWSEDPEFDTEP